MVLKSVHQEQTLPGLRTEFDPLEIVSAPRLIPAIFEAMEYVFKFAAQQGYSGVVFESTSPTRIKFISGLGFEDYRQQRLSAAREEGSLGAEWPRNQPGPASPSRTGPTPRLTSGESGL